MGPFRLFWSVVLPMSRPILGVVSVFAVIASWKDFLWPLLVLREPDLQPLSVRLPTLQATTDLGTLMAALAISTVIPVLFFLVFERSFLRGGRTRWRAQGLSRLSFARAADPQQPSCLEDLHLSEPPLRRSAATADRDGFGVQQALPVNSKGHVRAQVQSPTESLGGWEPAVVG